MNDLKIGWGRRSIFEIITRELIRQNITAATMESCTAGLLASLLTDTEGASAVFRGGLVTYSNEAKIRHGVPAEVIAQFGVYSPETAAAMAAACRKTFQTDLGIGITGTFGNVDPNNADSTPGQIWFAVDRDGGCRAYGRSLPICADRREYKLTAAREVAEVLLKEYL